MKTCSRHKKGLCAAPSNPLPTSFFSRDAQRSDGLHPSCKMCRKKYNKENNSRTVLKRKEWYRNNPEKVRAFLDKNRDKDNARTKAYYKQVAKFKSYGITAEIYEEMLLFQQGRCAICGIHKTKFRKSLQIDHCHKTKVVRGLLCGGCNRGLGIFKDDVRLLKRAVLYIQRSEKG